MRLAPVCAVVAVFFAFAAVAQLSPGVVVSSGDVFPVIADINGDGLDDIIQERAVVLNHGGSFGDPIDLGLPPGQRVYAALDVNGDHQLDLLTVETAATPPVSVDPNARSGGAQYRLYIANAPLQYSAPIDITTGAPPYVADVDGDGKDDIVLMTYIFNGIRSVATDVTVLRSHGDGTFERLPVVRMAADPQIAPEYRIQSGDVDRDGMTDLVIRCPQDLVILHGLGGGRFSVEENYVPSDMSYGLWDTRLADVDGDSNLDVIMVGLRSIRVLFGDGHGHFPRMTTATIPKLHDAAGVPMGVPIDVNRMIQPRNLAIGHFTRSDRTEIAAGMGEGDLVVFAYEQGALREVSRTQTDFWLLDVLPGVFHHSNLTDLYVFGTLIYGDMYPHPRIFSGPDVMAMGHSPVTIPARRRGASRHGASPNVNLRVERHCECVDDAVERWSFVRDGVFGTARSGQTQVEAVFDGNLIFFRLSAPWNLERATSTLTGTNGIYTATFPVLTTCGWKTMTMTATLE